MTGGAPWCIANLGAEEAGPRGGAASARAETAAALWRALFDPAARAFAWLPGAGEAVAWLNTEAAAREAGQRGLRLAGAAPAIVRRVHDKAFALAAAERLGLVPPALAGLTVVLEPAELQPAARGLERVRAAQDAWPAWARRRFTLKPRIGSGGRGRVAGGAQEPAAAALAGALGRLARCGGALLEPWLERTEDLSAQLFVAEGGEVILLGTLRQDVTPSGVVRGHTGVLLPGGAVVSGSRHDPALRRAAAALGRAAADAGFVGPCGVDAFAFRAPDGDETLRPVVELNARYTLGMVALGLALRALPGARAALGLAPAAAAAFGFALARPTRRGPAADARRLQLPALPGHPAGAQLWFGAPPEPGGTPLEIGYPDARPRGSR